MRKAGQPKRGAKDGPKAAALAAQTPRRTNIKDVTVSITFYVLPHEHKRLREVALKLDITLQELALLGIDRVLADQSQPPVERYGRTRKKRD